MAISELFRPQPGTYAVADPLQRLLAAKAELPEVAGCIDVDLLDPLPRLSWAEPFPPPLVSPLSIGDARPHPLPCLHRGEPRVLPLGSIFRAKTVLIPHLSFARVQGSGLLTIDISRCEEERRAQQDLRGDCLP